MAEDARQTRSCYGSESWGFESIRACPVALAAGGENLVTDMLDAGLADALCLPGGGWRDARWLPTATRPRRQRITLS